MQCVQAMGQRAFVLQNRLTAADQPARNKVDARGRGAGQVHFVAIHTPGSDLRPGGGVVITGQQVVYDSLVGQFLRLHTDPASQCVKKLGRVVVIVRSKTACLRAFLQHRVPKRGVAALAALYLGAIVIYFHGPDPLQADDIGHLHAGPCGVVVGGKAAAAFQVVGQLLRSLQTVPIAHGHRRGQAFAVVQNIASGRPLHGFVAQDAVDVVGLAQSGPMGAAELHQFGHRGIFLFQRCQLLQRGGILGRLHQPAGGFHAGQ